MDTMSHPKRQIISTLFLITEYNKERTPYNQSFLSVMWDTVHCDLAHNSMFLIDFRKTVISQSNLSWLSLASFYFTEQRIKFIRFYLDSHQ